MSSVFAKNLRFLREEREISQTDMGDRLGLTRASIDAYEDGRAMPPYPKLKRIADHFKLSVETMTEEELWESPIEKEIERIKQGEIQDEEKDIILREEGSDATLEEQLYSLNINLEEKSASKTKGLPDIPLGAKRYFVNYLNKSWSWLEPQLKRVAFDLPKGAVYRAFEMGQDFPVSNSVVITSPLESFSDLEDGERYVVVSKSLGVIYRTVFSQVGRKGTVILSGEVGDVDTQEVLISEIKEIWKVEAYYSSTLPKPDKDFSALKDLVAKLSAEFKRLS